VEYFSNYEGAVNLMSQLKDGNKKISGFILEQEKFKLQNDFFSFLIKPVQRLGKYELFLRDVVKNTDPDLPDYADIKEMHQLMEQVNIKNDKGMNAKFSTTKIIELQKFLLD
jgi:hypothetical protein